MQIDELHHQNDQLKIELSRARIFQSRTMGSGHDNPEMLPTQPSAPRRVELPSMIRNESHAESAPLPQGPQGPQGPRGLDVIAAMRQRLDAIDMVRSH